MRINQGFTAHGRGWVRAVFSRRMRGYALPLGLVRVHLRTVNSAAFARRLREAFAGYLVSDSECGAFSHRREQYQPVLVGTFCTGFQYDPRGGHLDAPDFVAAGSMYKNGGRWLPIMSFVIRGAS